MLAISRSTVIAAPAARIFDQLTEPRNLLEIWPSLVDVANPRIAADGGHAFDWTYRMAGVKLRGHCDTAEAERPCRRVDRNRGAIPSTFSWTFAARGDATEVKLEIQYDVPTVVRLAAGPLLRVMNEREAETLLWNLKTRMETDVVPVSRSE